MKAINRDFVSNVLKPRAKATHKYDYGKAGFVSGSKGMAGACVLNMQAAYRVGVGLVKALVPESIYPIVEMGCLEAITVPFDEKNFKITLLQKEILDDVDVVASGSGSANCSRYTELLSYLLMHCDVPLVLDAEGINQLNEEALLNHKQPLILTPHHGEFERLIQREIDKPAKLAKEFALNYHVYLVLKSHQTLIATPDGKIYVNTTGNPGMATAGSGDVLAGMIAGLLAQSQDIIGAICAAVYLHGLAGDLAASELGEMSVMASDINDFIAAAILNVRV